MVSLFVSVPPFLLSKPVEEWARYYFGQVATPDATSSEPFKNDSVYIAEIEGMGDEEVAIKIVLDRVAEIHERYAEWTPRYSAAQMSQGLWAMFSFPGGFDLLLADEELDAGRRDRAMRSLVVPYRVYVKGWNPNEAMPHDWDMLWDLVLDGVRPVRDLAPVALECLQEILAIDDARCQAAALHGLNHLDHPDRLLVVQKWMDAHRNEDWNWKWVEACRNGSAM